MNEKIRNSNGFTLIELLVVVSLFGLIFTSAIGVFVMIIKNKEKTDEMINIRREVGEGMSVITREIINARGLNFSGDWGGCDNGEESNSIMIRNAEGVDVTIGANPEGNITANNSRVIINGGLVDIEDLSFSCEKGSLGNRYAIEFLLRINNNGIEEDYVTWAVVRNEI